MTENEIKERWASEKPFYSAWGEYVLCKISQALEKGGKDLRSFFKVPAKCRLKDEDSLIDKAFYRPNKIYTDPYNQIEDKVGVRFIVLLLDDIKEICNIIESSEFWVSNTCRHFQEDRDKEPLLFTYQSVHYILQPRSEISYKDVTIPANTSCEVQIRTLLQHAHAELTHDAIYKSKKNIKPKVHRTVAKSMALIETTDDFFGEVTQLLNYGPLQEHNIIDRLNGIYFSIIGVKSHIQKSSIIIWDEFERLIDENLIDNIQYDLDERPYIPAIIKKKYSESTIYQQSTVLFIYWMLLRRKRILLQNWPFSKKMLEPLAIDLGISIEDD